MKEKALIQRLEDTASKVQFPTENTKFYNFKSGLRSILMHNFGNLIAKTLEYDEYLQTFFIEIEYTHVVYTKSRPAGVGPLCFTVKRNIQIFPHVGLVPQLERIEETMSEVNTEALNAAERFKIGIELDNEELYPCEKGNRKFSIGDVLELHGLEEYPELNGETIEITNYRDSDALNGYYIKSQSGNVEAFLNFVWEKCLRRIES